MSAPGYKRIYLAKRVPSAKPEEFAALWKSHAAFGSQYPVSRGRFVRGRQCSRIVGLQGVPGATEAYDGVGLIWAKSLETARQKLDDPALRAKFEEDERRVFYDIVANFSVLGEEHVIRDGPPEGVCVITFLRSPDGSDPDAFFARTREGWLARIANRPEVARPARRIGISRVLDARTPGCLFDAVSEFWFATAEDAKAAFGGGSLASARADTGASEAVTLVTYVSHGWQVDAAGRPL